MSVWSSAGRPSGLPGKRSPGAARRLSRALGGMAITAGAMAALAVLLLEPPEFVTQAPARAGAPRPDWVDIVRPFQLYAMPSQTFGTEPRRYAARRHLVHGDRIDIMTFGAEEPGAGNWLRLEIRRYGEVAEPAVAFYPEIARLAARAGHAIARAGLPGAFETRFGPVEMGDIQLGDGGTPTPCIGFRVGRQEPGISFSGLACGTSARPLDRPTLACAINRLDLIASGDDRALGAYFAATEVRRHRDCAQVRQVAPQDGAWLRSAEKPAPLKGSLARAEQQAR